MYCTGSWDGAWLWGLDDAVADGTSNTGVCVCVRACACVCVCVCLVCVQYVRVWVGVGVCSMLYRQYVILCAMSVQIKNVKLICITLSVTGYNPI